MHRRSLPICPFGHLRQISNTGAAKKAKDVALVTLNLNDPKIEEKIVDALVDGAWKMSPNVLGTTSDIIVFKKHPTNPKYLKALVDGKELDAYPEVVETVPYFENPIFL